MFVILLQSVIYTVRKFVLNFTYPKRSTQIIMLIWRHKMNMLESNTDIT